MCMHIIVCVFVITDKKCVKNWMDEMAKRGCHFAKSAANEVLFPFLDEWLIANPCIPPDIMMLKGWASFLSTNIVFTKCVRLDGEYQQRLYNVCFESLTVEVEHRRENDQGRGWNYTQFV